MNEDLSKDEEFLVGNEDIVLKDIAYFLVRNSRKLITFLSIGLSISLIHTLRLKNVWQGEFQIVLDNEESQLNNMFQTGNKSFDLILDKKNSSKLTTEVEILKSASILMPIYKSSILRDENHPNNNKPISFRQWTGNLEVELEKGTSVLKIKYKNSNKKSILPILVDISEVYQKYSTNNLDKNLSKGINYLTNQISFFRKKSNISYENSQKFALENDLKIIKNTPLVLSTKFENPISNNNLNVQDQNTKAAIEKRLLYKLVEYFREEETDNEKLAYLAKSYELIDRSTVERLDQIQNDINKSKATFTDKYSKTKELEKQKKALLTSIKESSLKIILAKIDAADIVMKSSERPDGVYIEFNRLNNEYIRDSYTLIDLESQLMLLKLEKAKEPEPYKLITIPTLIEGKIAPVRSRILIIHSLFLIFISVLYLYIQEKARDYIYSTRELENLIPYNLLEKIPSNSLEKWNEYIDSVSSLYLKNKSKIEIIKLGNIDQQILDLFLSKMNTLNPALDIKIINNISEINNKNMILLLTQSGKIKRDEIANFKRRVNYSESSIMGWILFEEILSFNQTKIEN